MHWRVVAAGVLILTMLFGGIFLLNHLGSVYDSVIWNIDKSISAVLEAENDDGKGVFEARKIWESELPLICTFVTHTQIDVISQKLELAQAHLEEQAWMKYLELLREIRYGLQLLKKYDRPSIRSVL